MRENDFEDGSQNLYRLLEHYTDVPRFYNFIRGSTNDGEPKPAAAIGERMTNIMVTILEARPTPPTTAATSTTVTLSIINLAMVVAPVASCWHGEHGTLGRELGVDDGKVLQKWKEICLKENSTM
ncbi:hypothetical protein GUJ93_ZPchr0013g37902 [Zizania palustris]|uniref:Uncharacterized protein n=1 Tax=Zizania palustris TaxID=103762 RepID=A0A8J5WSW8_ZIZPA|nr:hypothetical protein GUJ93_ZPchr0013g37902 [Zizania palustris]